jgi:hypothetical protein
VPSFPRELTIAGITFTVPPELRYHADGFVSSGEAIEEFYANVPLGPACSSGCGIRSFSPLPADAVVVGLGVLSGAGVGAPNPNDPPPNTTIAGHAAVFTSQKPGGCGGDETIDVWIPGPGQSSLNAFLLRACLKGPDLAVGEHVLDMLIATATSTSG